MDNLVFKISAFMDRTKGTKIQRPSLVGIPDRLLHQLPQWSIQPLFDIISSNLVLLYMRILRASERS